MQFSSKTYDILKWIAQLLLPAVGTLYFALAKIWGFPYAQEVLGTITAIDTFLGVILGLTSTSYAGDGVLEIDTSDPETDRYRINLNVPIDEIPANKQFLLKVKDISNVEISRGQNS